MQGPKLSAASWGAKWQWGWDGAYCCCCHPEKGLTWDLLLDADALYLFVALGTDAAVTPFSVLTLLVLS